MISLDLNSARYTKGRRVLMYISQSNSTFLATRTISKPFENGSKLFGFREEKKWEAPNILGSFSFFGIT